MTIDLDIEDKKNIITSQLEQDRWFQIGLRKEDAKYHLADLKTPELPKYETKKVKWSTASLYAFMRGLRP